MTIKDPLTPEGFNKFLEQFKDCVKVKYQAALASGALTEQEAGSHIVLKSVIVITAARQCTPLSDEGRKVLRNLEKFI